MIFNDTSRYDKYEFPQFTSDQHFFVFFFCFCQEIISCTLQYATDDAFASLIIRSFVNFISRAYCSFKKNE